MRIHIEGPSSPFRSDALAAGVARLASLGHTISGHDDALRGRHAYLNGDDGERKSRLERALASDVDVLWLARGGYGLTRITDDIVVPERVPVVVGFSDTTALFGRLARAGHLQRCVHGPLATTIAQEPADSIERALAVIARRAGAATTTPPALPALRPLVRAAHGGADDVQGHLWAGNLVVLAALIGTASMPSLAGHIVVLEEVGERPYRLDRLLTQLLRSGAFDGVRAFVIGHLTSCDEPAPSTPPAASATRDAAPRGLDVVVERLSGAGVPVVCGLPCGHEAPNLALPLGATARLRVFDDTALMTVDDDDARV